MRSFYVLLPTSIIFTVRRKVGELIPSIPRRVLLHILYSFLLSSKHTMCADEYAGSRVRSAS